LYVAVVNALVLLKQYEDKTMCASPSHWKRLNIVDELLTSADVTTWDIASVDRHINRMHYIRRSVSESN